MNLRTRRRRHRRHTLPRPATAPSRQQILEAIVRARKHLPPGGEQGCAPGEVQYPRRFSTANGERPAWRHADRQAGPSPATGPSEPLLFELLAVAAVDALAEEARVRRQALETSRVIDAFAPFALLRARCSAPRAIRSGTAPGPHARTGPTSALRIASLGCSSAASTRRSERRVRRIALERHRRSQRRIVGHVRAAAQVQDVVATWHHRAQCDVVALQQVVERVGATVPLAVRDGEGAVVEDPDEPGPVPTGTRVTLPYRSQDVTNANGARPGGRASLATRTGCPC